MSLGETYACGVRLDREASQDGATSLLRESEIPEKWINLLVQKIEIEKLTRLKIDKITKTNDKLTRR